MKTMWAPVVLSLVFLASVTSASRILAIVPMPSYSHQYAFHPIWKEMSLRGHQVTLLTTDPVNDPKLTNLTEINLHHSYSLIRDVYKTLNDIDVLTLILLLNNKFITVANQQLADANVKKLLKKDNMFDVVLVESFFPEFLAFAELYGCPKILINSMEASCSIHHSLGNTAHPAVNPEYTLPFSGQLSFTERLISSFYFLFIVLFRAILVYPEKHSMLKRHFGNSVPSVAQLLDDVDMLFLNINPVLSDIRAMGPATITYGGGVHIKPVEDLPKDLKHFLDSAREGFIYFSLGSNVKSKDLNEQKMNAVLETLRELPYKVLWKFELGVLPGKPDNVKLVEWAPQQDILRHPNIKLFITHGGLQSIDEAVFSHVPMVVLPFFADQWNNAKRITNKGIAKVVSHKVTLVKEEFKSAILEVAQNPKYRENIKKIAKLALDEPLRGIDKVIWWTEYVIRNKGAKHLRNHVVDVPLYQYFFLDIIAFVILLLFIAGTVLIWLFRIIIKLVRMIKKKVKND